VARFLDFYCPTLPLIRFSKKIFQWFQINQSLALTICSTMVTPCLTARCKILTAAILREKWFILGPRTRTAPASIALIFLALALSGCSLGSHTQGKAHLIQSHFIPLHTAPCLCPKAQTALRKTLPAEYAAKREILERGKEALGPFGPLPD
jgi:hypothetical protein